MKKLVYITLLLGLFIHTACEEKKGCDDCGGGILEGFIFKEVTTDDLSALGTVEGIELGVCIRYKLDGTEFDLETVKVVDDCCCVE